MNLANRVAGIARPGTVLATKEIRDATREAFDWSSGRARNLKGVSEPMPLYRARGPAGREPEPATEPASA